MQRPGADPVNMQMEDFLCDFCAQPWHDTRPLVEGHRGACVCGRCLAVAYTEVVLMGLSTPAAEGEACRLCLEALAGQPHWRSPLDADAIACTRCIKQSAGVLHKDPDVPWRKPTLA